MVIVPSIYGILGRKQIIFTGFWSKVLDFFIIGISIVYVKIKLYTKFDAKMLIRSKVMID